MPLRRRLPLPTRLRKEASTLPLFGMMGPVVPAEESGEDRRRRRLAELLARNAPSRSMDGTPTTVRPEDDNDT